MCKMAYSAEKREVTLKTFDQTSSFVIMQRYYLLIPWCRIVNENLIVTQLAKQ
jgi:hypothetical protein